jgi:fatty acid desaturase
MHLDLQNDSSRALGVQSQQPRAGAAEYARLRRSVIAAGLLERAPKFYLLRGRSCYLILAAGLSIPLILPGLLGSLLAVLVIGIGLLQVGVLGHDAAHLAVFQGVKANWALGMLCWSVTLGISFWSWRDRHNRHHANTNDMEDDPDIFSAGLIAFTPEEARARRGWRRWVTRRQAVVYPFLFPFVTIALRVDGWRFALTQLHGGRRWLELALLSLNVGLWAAAIVLFGWQWLGIFIGSQLVGGLYQGLVVAPNHKGMPLWTKQTKLSFLERQVLSSRNVAPHPFWDFFFGGLNYQVEHHLFPNMPRVHLNRARDLVMQLCDECDLEREEMGAFASYRAIFVEMARIGRFCAEPARETESLLQESGNR